MGPAADQDQVCRPAPVPGIPADQSLIQIAQEGKDHLDPLVRERRSAVLEFAPKHIGEEPAANALPDVAAVRLLFDHILHRRVVIKLDLTYFFKTAAQNAGIVQQHPVFNVAILQDVQDIVGHEGNELPVFRVGRLEGQEIRLRVPLGDIPKRRRFREPLSRFQEGMVGLVEQEVRVEHMSQLMGKQTADHLIPHLPPLLLSHKRVAGVDVDQEIVRAGQTRRLGLPLDVQLHPPPAAIPPRLGGGDIGKMGCQDAGGEKLAVCDFGLFLRDQLLDLFMTHSCQE